MNLNSDLEKHWGHVPELKRLFADSAVPSQYFHHGGMRSPYTTIFDDLANLGRIVAVVGNGKDRLASLTDSVPFEESPRQRMIRLRLLIKELEFLRNRLNREFGEFLRENDRNLAELCKLLSHRLYETEATIARHERGANPDSG